MVNTSNLRRGRTCVFALHAHLVFVTKYRKNIFTKPHIETLRHVFQNVCNDFDVQLVEIDGERDHIHLLVNYPPKIALSRLINSSKGVSSRMLKKEFPEIVQNYWGNALWSPSYFASSCGGAPLEIVKQHIRQQTTPS